MSSSRRSSPLHIPSYNERDPLLQWTQLIGRTPPPMTPPPSYYQSPLSSDFSNALPSYQEASGGPQNNRRTNIQDASNSGDGFYSPEPRPNAYGGLAAVAFFCCCFSPLACIALYYSARVKEYYEAGEYTRAKKASRRTLTCSVVAIIIGISLLALASSTLFCALYGACRSSVVSVF